MRVAIAIPGLVGYPAGGGHWQWAIQYIVALRNAGCEVACLSFSRSSGSPSDDDSNVQIFRKLLESYCPGTVSCAVLYPQGKNPDWAQSRYIGMDQSELRMWARSADFLWNLGATVPVPFLSLFKRKALVDIDPGLLHVSAFDYDLGFDQHDWFFSVGLNLGQQSCGVPTFGKQWLPFPQVLVLEMWPLHPDPGSGAPFTSVTHWTWDELEWNGRRLSISKREAYLEIVDLPCLSGVPMSLAANLDDPEDTFGDKRLFESSGWTMKESWSVSSTPDQYLDFIANSRAEICAPKPIYVELVTGWISDRSVGYLATGRPVLMKETGLRPHLPTGEGLLTYRSLEEAVDMAREIDGNFRKHSKRARELAEDFLDSRKVVRQMLDECR